MFLDCWQVWSFGIINWWEFSQLRLAALAVGFHDGKNSPRQGPIICLVNTLEIGVKSNALESVIKECTTGVNIGLGRWCSFSKSPCWNLFQWNVQKWLAGKYLLQRGRSLFKLSQCSEGKKKIQPATFFDREPYPTNPKVNMQCSLRYPFALIFMLKGFGAIFPWICYGTWLCWIWSSCPPGLW